MSDLGRPMEPDSFSPVPSPSAWMSEAEYDRRRGELGSAQVHMTACHTRGELFMRLVDDRFRGLPRRELKVRLAEIRETLAAMGGTIPVDRTRPLHQQLEFLDNVLDFEVSQPCGCGKAGGPPMAEA